MDKNEDFYILESGSRPGMYYSRNPFGLTDEVLREVHFSSPEEALKYVQNPFRWNVYKVHLDVQLI